MVIVKIEIKKTTAKAVAFLLRNIKRKPNTDMHCLGKFINKILIAIHTEFSCH